MKTRNKDKDHRTGVIGIGVLLLAVSMCAGQGAEVSNLFALDNRGMTAYAGTLPPGETVIPESRVVTLGTVFIPSDSRLVVQKDNILKLDGLATTLTVEGELMVQGTVDQPVIITSFKDDTRGDTNNDGQASSPAPGNWQGIVVGPSGKLTLNNAEIRYAVNGINTSGQDTQITVNKTKILNCQQYGIRIAHQGCQFEVKTSLIAKNGSGGIYLSTDSFTRPKRFYHCTVADNIGPGIYFTGCKLDINSSIVAFNRNGVTCGSSETSELGIQYSNLYNPGWSNISGITYNLIANGNNLLDPLFVNRTGNDYRLSANSPAIDSSWSAGTETDILLRPLYDDKGVANTGRGGCWFGDMGAYERQEDSYSVDLVASHIFSLSDPVISSGQTIELNWTVGNQGNLDPVGTWTDNIYLSKDEYLGSDDILIGQAQITSGLAAGEYYEELISVVVPQIQGINYLLLVVDADKECDTTFRSNNVALSVRPVLIDLPVIDIVDGLTDTIINKSWNYYLFNNPSAQNVKISFQSHSTNTLGVYAIENAIPDMQRFDYNSVSVGGVASLIVPADTNDLIVGVYGEKVSVAQSPLDISVDAAAMTIQSVFPNRIGNAGNATLRLVGESLSPAYEFSLDNGQGHKIIAVVMPDVSDWMGAVFLEFDMTGASQGNYVLSVVDSEGLHANYGQPITVVNSDGTPKFKGTVQLPGMARPLFVSNVTVTYENNGLNDLYSPMLTLVGPQGAQWQLPGEDGWLESDKCQFMALSSSGWANVLRPGQKESINVKMRVPSTYTAEWVNVQLFSKGLHENDGSARVQDWVYEVTDSEIAATLEAAYGRTQGDYIKLLGQAAARFGIYDSRVYSAKTLELAVPYIQKVPSEPLLPLIGSIQIPLSDVTRDDKYRYDYQNTLVYEWDGINWIIPDQNKKFTGSTVILIHGWNATLNTPLWESRDYFIFNEIAKALINRGVEHVLGIGWNSRGNNVTPEMLEQIASIPPEEPALPEWAQHDPFSPANQIPYVADEVFEQLNNRIDPGNTHIIGHSHGAHLAGMIGNKFASQKIRRITALDASSELSHIRSKGNYLGQGWGTKSAQFVVFYKSSYFAGGYTSWGHDNFGLVPNGKSFGLYDGDHGYPLIWFLNTIHNANSIFGYNWDSANKRKYLETIVPKFVGQKDKPWIGMIRGEGDQDDVLELITVAKNVGPKIYESGDEWNYPGSWTCFLPVFAETGLINLARTVEYECKGISILPESKIWKPEESGLISVTIHNYADNKSFTNLMTSSLDEDEDRVLLIHTLYLSRDQYLDVETDYLFNWYDHLLNNYIGPEQTKTIESDFKLPSTRDLKKWLELDDNDSIDGDYYLILDLCSTQIPDIESHELYPSDNIGYVSIRIEEDGFYADMGFKELTFTLEEGQSSVTHMLSGETSYHSSKELTDSSLRWEWHINNQLISAEMKATKVFNEGRHEIVLTLIDTETGKESKDWGVIVVKEKDKEGDKDDEQRTRANYPIDPEDKFGPAGYDSPETSESELKRYISETDPVHYRIEFWNEENAQVPAAIVSMEDALDSNVFNLESVRFTRIGFLRWDIELENARVVDKTIDCRPDMDILVHITTDYNPDSGVILWRFETLDPETGLLPEDPMSGFLPAFDPSTGYALGWMEFKVDLLPGLETGTQIANQAFGEFDDSGQIALRQNPAPPDGPWINTIDAGKPTSSMNPLHTQSSPRFTLCWQGQDDEGGSGVVAYDIYISKDGEPFTLWRTVEDTSTHFVGIPGSVYQFYSIARDGVGHFEEKAPVAEAQTRVYLTGDLTRDDVVNIEDLVFLASCWLSDCPEIDIAPAYVPDGIIDLLDLAELSNDWLKAVIE